jgi:hypothetical protein
VAVAAGPPWIFVIAAREASRVTSMDETFLYHSLMVRVRDSGQ